MTQKNILEVPFWKLSLRFSIGFIVVLTIILTIVTYVRNGNFDAISQSLEDGSWQKFVYLRFVLAIAYGILMAFFSRNKAKKALKNK